MTQHKAPGRPVDKARRAARKQGILAVAARYFAAHGYAHTDLTLLAAAAQVSKPTLYYYFQSKEGLFLSALEAEVGRLQEAVLSTGGARDPYQELCTAIRAYLAFFDANPHVVELLIEERAHFKALEPSTYFTHREETLPHWRSLLQALMDSGRVRAIDVDAWIEVVSNTLYGTVFSNHFRKRSMPYEAQAAQMLQVFMSGLFLEEVTMSCEAIATTM